MSIAYTSQAAASAPEEVGRISFYCRAVFGLSVLFTTLSAALLAQKGLSGSVAMTVGLLIFSVGARHPRAATAVLFFLTPAAGFLNNLSLSAQSIPLLLGPLSGWALRMAWDSSHAGRPRFVDRPLCILWMLLIGTFSLSAAAAVVRYVALVWPDLSAPVAPRILDWARELSLKNALGWVAWGFLMNTAGALVMILLPREDFRLWVRSVGAGFLVAIPLGLFQVAGHARYLNSVAFQGHPFRINATFPDPNILGICLALFLPIALGEATRRCDESFVRRWSMIAFVSALFLLLAYSGSRSPLLGLAVSSVVAACTLLRYFRRDLFQKKGETIALLLIVLLSVIGLGFYSPLGKRLKDSYLLFLYAKAEVSSSRPENAPDYLSFWARVPGGRWQVWSRAWEMVRERPLLGTGPGTYLIEIRRLESSRLFPIPNDNAGNHYLQTWVEGGAVALFSLLGILAGTARWGLSRMAAHPSGQVLSLFSAFCGTAVAILFGSSLLSLEVGLLFWSMAAFLWSPPAFDNPRPVR